jgi:two-component sensor histidine kinase
VASLTDVNRLLALESTGLLDTTPEEAFDRITRLTSRALATPVALISLVDTERQFFKSQFGLPAPYAETRQTPLSHSFCQHVVLTENVLRINDAREDALVRENLAVRDLNVVAYLGVPLSMPDGSVLGSLCAIDNKPRDWDDGDVAALKDLAQTVMNQIALHFEMGKRAEAERQQALLIAELHHRVKNTLAVVQSIITMSARTAADVAGFRDAVVARLVSLANTHTSLVNQEWESASLTELLRGEVTTHAEEGRVLLDGPEINLPSQSAVALGMCVHELMTNAVKHGALSKEAGRVEIAWALDHADGAPVLTLRWTESGGPPVARPERRGFGSLLLDRIVAQQPEGTLTLDYAAEGLKADIRMSLPQRVPFGAR